MEKGRIDRYSRQLMMPEVGVEGQKKLFKSNVLVIGAGGIGCPALQYLVAAGVGNIAIADFDKVDFSNLQRQILFSEQDVGRSKVEVAAEKLFAMNSDVQITPITSTITLDNVLELIDGFDVVIDASDNFATRYVVNDACFIKEIPLVSGSIFRMEGQVSVFNLNEHSPCYRCLYPSPPPQSMIPNCSEGGALGSVAGVIGAIQATECFKILLQNGEILSGSVMNLNLFDLDISLLDINKHEGCKLCGSSVRFDALIPEWYDFSSWTNVCGRIKKISKKELVLSTFEGSESVRLINVKEIWENSGYTPMSNELLLPLSLIESDPRSLVGKISHQGKNVFYCQDGSRAERAIVILEEELGFSNLYSFSGDLNKVLSNKLEEV